MISLEIGFIRFFFLLFIHFYFPQVRNALLNRVAFSCFIPVRKIFQIQEDFIHVLVIIMFQNLIVLFISVKYF